MRQDPLYDYLRSVDTARADYVYYRALSEAVRLQAEHKTATIKPVPVAHNADRDAILAQLAHASSIADEYERVYLERKAEVEEFLNRLEEPHLCLLMKLRYVECMEWSSIRDRVALLGQRYDYTLRYIFKLHGLALNKCRKLWYKDHKEEDSET